MRLVRQFGVVFVLLVMVLLGLSGSAQQSPVLRATTYSIAIDALVSDGGRPVVSLSADDFEVLDKGIPQRLDSAESAGHVAVALAIDTSLRLARRLDAHLHVRLGARILRVNRAWVRRAAGRPRVREIGPRWWRWEIASSRSCR